jgi:hypothetical protein
MVDTWYDLAIRDLSDLTDPAKEKLAEAPFVEGPEEEAEAALDAHWGSLKGFLVLRSCFPALFGPSGPAR